MTMSLVMPTDQCNIITLAQAGVDAPAWARRLRWPGTGDDHITLPQDGGDSRVWASRLDAAVLRAERPVLILAEGIGCFAASWWGRLSPSHYVSKVAGALLFDPGHEEEAQGRYASPAISLPFPSVVVGDGSAVDTQRLIRDWGSRFVDGTRTRDSAPVAWGQARRLMLRLTRKVVERDIDQAYALHGRTPQE